MLRSMQELKNYTIGATDGDIGHVQGMLVDEGTWALRYLVVETANWWGGHQVLISPNWIGAINWTDSTVSVNVSGQAVKANPRFDSTAEVNRQHEMDLFHHYHQPAYWDGEVLPGLDKNREKLNA
jgi:hypothetical protein